MKKELNFYGETRRELVQKLEVYMKSKAKTLGINYIIFNNYEKLYINQTQNGFKCCILDTQYQYYKAKKLGLI